MDSTYEFHADWDINSTFATSEIRLSEEQVKEYFRADIERMIPAEYRHRIKYYCELSSTGSGLYHVSWLYSGSTRNKEIRT